MASFEIGMIVKKKANRSLIFSICRTGDENPEPCLSGERLQDIVAALRWARVSEMAVEASMAVFVIILLYVVLLYEKF